MRDRAVRMFNDAQDRLHDADILARSLSAISDSQALLRILAFEVLLKCALLVSGQEPKRTHKYADLWDSLPAAAQEEVLAVASENMPDKNSLVHLDRVLNAYQFVFEKARYYYEFYEWKSLEEQREEGASWVAQGAPVEEARVQYYPLELRGLIAGLVAYVEARLYSSYPGMR